MTVLDLGPAREKISEYFTILYGREPYEPEVATLVSLGIGEAGSAASDMRRVLASFASQTHASPFTIRFGPDDIQTVEIDGMKFVLDKADRAVSRPLIVARQYEPHLTRFLRERVKPGMRCLDIGANVGYYTLLLSKLVGPEGRVTAFEPNSENARLIMLSVQKNEATNIDLVPVALSRARGAAVFSTYVGSNGGLLAGREQMLLAPQAQVVPTFALDEIVNGRVDFIKMDVEGGEGLVIEGGKKTITENRPIITSEFSPVMLKGVSRMDALEYLRFFTGLGYKIFSLRDSPEPVEIDPDAYMAAFSWTPPTRIEDFAFLPE